MSRKSFINGFSRALDLGATQSKKIVKKSSPADDNVKLKEDWVKVGKDIQFGIKKYRDCKQGGI